jgi:LysR family glycine cleavage system transcriptional activator
MRLPPLNALRAFEAAARLGGFARAGEEMHVSPGAVSRHGKLLEAYFGTPLFVRLAQGLKPTEAAMALLPRITAAFETIAAAAAEVPGAAGRLNVIASPTFASRLLVPRLPGFTDPRPEVSVSVGVLLSDLAEFDLADHDCAIATFHAPVWPEGLRVARIRGEALTPLCAPALLGAREAPPRLEDLGDQTLLHIAACVSDWPNWLELNGLADAVDPSRGPTFETGELAVRAAVEGLGVVVMDRFLVRRELAAGELIDLFPESEPVDNGYFFICAEKRWDEPVIAAFREWVLTEFADGEG